MIKYIRAGFFALLLLFFLIFSFGSSYAEADSSSLNRFNVVIVLDASNSMNYTDPTGLRYEAIGQFTSLLAEKGNYLGGVVFSNHIGEQSVPESINNQEQKNNIVELLKSVTSEGVTDDTGYTNIGEALSAATDMLVQSGNPDLPSVILFLSDGNTEMPTEDEQSESLDLKAGAIQAARENNIKIYSVCLNANSKADITEMNQISNATGGVCKEVSKPEDLQDVFNTFYSLIYGTSAVTLFDDVIPASGELETLFQVPGLGVEEVNIVINGSIKDCTLFDPFGNAADAIKVISDTFTIIKITNIIPGRWKLLTSGVEGDRIKINMIYNTDLGIDVNAEPESLKVTPGSEIKFIAKLKSGNDYAKTDEEYEGYYAKLQIKDAYGENIDSIPMSVKEGAFVASYLPKEGTYFANVSVTGNNLEKTSENIGPINVSNDLENEEAKAAPIPAENPVEKVVYIWPFKGGHTSIDMTTLVMEPKDDMRYDIVSSSFMQGKDYKVIDKVISMDHFSLSKGSFDIKITNIKGLSCNVEVIVKSYNVGIMTVIGIAIIAIIVLLIILINIWYWSRKPFRGSIKVTSYCDGNYKESTKNPRRGKCKLSAFGIGPVGIDYNKSYFQATGQQYIFLCTNVPVMHNGTKVDRIRILSGTEVSIAIKEGEPKLLYIRFDSRMRRSSGTRR